jgi:hypothetical protein
VGAFRVAVIDEQAQGEERGRDGYREIDVEAPAPGQDLGQRPAEHKADWRAAAGDRAEDPERLGSIGTPGECDCQEPESGGREESSEHALQRPRGDQHLEGR